MFSKVITSCHCHFHSLFVFLHLTTSSLFVNETCLFALNMALSVTTPTNDTAIGNSVSGCSWRQSILNQLNERKLREQKPYEDVISCCRKLFESVDSLRNENVQLNIEKEKLQLAGGAIGGLASNKVLEQKAALEKKVYEMQEELTAMHRRKGENAQKIIELKNQLEEKERERLAVVSKLQDVEVELMASKGACRQLEQKIVEMESLHQVVKDEHQALQIAFNGLEKKFLLLEREHTDLVTRWMNLKAKDAERLNAENERMLRVQQEKMRQQLEEATKETYVDDSTVSHASDASGSDATLVCARIPKRVMLQFEAHEGEVNAIKWSAGDVVATGGGDRKVKLWEISPASTIAIPKGTLPGSNATITSIDLDQDLLLASSNDFASRVWTLSDMKLRRTLTGHSNKVLAVKFLGVSNRVVSGSHDRTLKIWDLTRHACIRTLFAGSSCNDLVTCHEQDSTIISGHFDKRIRFWDTRSEASANEILLQGKVTSLDISPDGSYLLSCSRDDTLKSLDLRMNQVVRTFSADGFKVGCDWTRCKFSPDSQYIVAGSSDGSVFIWNAASGKIEKVLRDQHSSTVLSCSWSSSGLVLMTADKNKRVVVWSD